MFFLQNSHAGILRQRMCDRNDPPRMNLETDGYLAILGTGEVFFQVPYDCQKCRVFIIHDGQPALGCGLGAIFRVCLVDKRLFSSLSSEEYRAGRAWSYRYPPRTLPPAFLKASGLVCLNSSLDYPP